MPYVYKYPRPAVTADCVVITKEAEPKVLLIQKGEETFKVSWAETQWLPFFDMHRLAFDHYDIMQDTMETMQIAISASLVNENSYSIQGKTSIFAWTKQ